MTPSGGAPTDLHLYRPRISTWWWTRKRTYFVFVMREVEGLSTAETAAALDINEDTVQTRLHRAKRLLRDHLDRRLGPAASEIYPFHLSRCDRVVAGVMAAITK